MSVLARAAIGEAGLSAKGAGDALAVFAGVASGAARTARAGTAAATAAAAAGDHHGRAVLLTNDASPPRPPSPPSARPSMHVNACTACPAEAPPPPWPPRRAFPAPAGVTPSVSPAASPVIVPVSWAPWPPVPPEPPSSAVRQSPVSPVEPGAPIAVTVMHRSAVVQQHDVMRLRTAEERPGRGIPEESADQTQQQQDDQNSQQQEQQLLKQNASAVLLLARQQELHRGKPHLAVAQTMDEMDDDRDRHQREPRPEEGRIQEMLRDPRRHANSFRLVSGSGLPSTVFGDVGPAGIQVGRHCRYCLIMPAAVSGMFFFTSPLASFCASGFGSGGFAPVSSGSGSRMSCVLSSPGAVVTGSG